MKKCSYLAGFVALAVALVFTPAGAQDSKALSIKQVMGKLNKGPNSLTATLGKDLQDDAPSWDDIQKETKDYVKFATALGKNDPPKGDKDSWDKLTKAYADNAKALADAADKKDKKTALAAHKKLTNACMDCHKQHKKA